MSDSTSAPKEPLFTLQLETNGGTFSPKSADELRNWIEKEQSFWQWISNVNAGNYAVGIKNTVTVLQSALTHAKQAVNSEVNYPDRLIQDINNAKKSLHRVFVTGNLPHSSTALAKRVEQFRVENPNAALSYLFTMLPPSGHQFDPHEIGTWRGFIEGISENYGLTSSRQKSYESLKKSTEGLLAKSDAHISGQTEKIDALHRDYEDICNKISAESGKQAEDFVELTQFVENTHNEMQKSHAALLLEHQVTLSNLQKVFKESMALRAPVQYWESRKKHHHSRSIIFGIIAFGSLALLAITLVGAAFWLLASVGISGKPDTWRISFLAILAVLGIWAVRLVVRLFLSHIHLSTDAAERVTMVQTYLSLLEGANLSNDEDRKLILMALFRPATDGLVKDEGLPNTFIEMLTRPGK